MRSKQMPPAKPVVLAFGGNDGSGGAGLTADIEALASHGCHVCPIVTAVTVQDSVGVQGFEPVGEALLARQARVVLRDMPVRAFKIGMLATAANAAAVAAVLEDYPRVPVVLDPVMRGGGGGSLAHTDRHLPSATGEQTQQTLLEVVRTRLLPLTSIATPNRGEARLLSGQGVDLDSCGRDLVDRGCRFVLMTGADEGSGDVVNRFYGAGAEGTGAWMRNWSWPRLPGSYHGSGCTLAAAIAGLLAHGAEPVDAVEAAQRYAWESLRQGRRLGRGQLLPDRLYWAGSEPYKIHR